jgi:prevent-host-death family protein
MPASVRFLLPLSTQIVYQADMVTASVPHLSVNVRELRQHLADYLGRVKDGETLIVVAHGQPVARLMPVEQNMPRAEIYGALKGRIWIAPDFDDDDPDTIAAAEADLDP